MLHNYYTVSNQIETMQNDGECRIPSEVSPTLMFSAKHSKPHFPFWRWRWLLCGRVCCPLPARLASRCPSRCRRTNICPSHLFVDDIFFISQPRHHHASRHHLCPEHADYIVD